MKHFKAASTSGMLTLACEASPGMLAYTHPSLRVIASMVIHVNLVPAGSCQIVDAVMDENSLV